LKELISNAKRIQDRPAKSPRRLRSLSASQGDLQWWIRDAVRDWQLYVLLLPAFAYVFIFHYVPMYGVVIAFKDYRTSLGILGSEWVGLRHFDRFIHFPNFWLIVRNTAQIGFYSLATFPCPVILALLINEIRDQRFKKTIQMITYAPYFLSTVVVCSMILLFFDGSSGIVNNIRASLGLERVQYITMARMFDDIYVWTGVWQTVGWGTIIYLASLSNVSPDLIEAARIDGAKRLRIIYHINIPVAFRDFKFYGEVFTIICNHDIAGAV